MSKSEMAWDAMLEGTRYLKDENEYLRKLLVVAEDALVDYVQELEDLGYVMGHGRAVLKEIHAALEMNE